MADPKSSKTACLVVWQCLLEQESRWRENRILPSKFQTYNSFTINLTLWHGAKKKKRKVNGEHVYQGQYVLYVSECDWPITVTSYNLFWGKLSLQRRSFIWFTLEHASNIEEAHIFTRLHMFTRTMSSVAEMKRRNKMWEKSNSDYDGNKAHCQTPCFAVKNEHASWTDVWFTSKARILKQY